MHHLPSSIDVAPRHLDPLPHPRTAPEDALPGLVGPAWIVRAVTHVPGVLRLTGSRLVFVSSRGPVFDVDLADLAITVPWHGRGGFRLGVGEEVLRLHVTRPPGAVEPLPSAVEAVVRAWPHPRTSGDAAATSTWRGLLLSGPACSSRRPGARRAGRSRRGSAD